MRNQQRQSSRVEHRAESHGKITLPTQSPPTQTFAPTADGGGGDGDDGSYARLSYDPASGAVTGTCANAAFAALLEIPPDELPRRSVARPRCRASERVRPRVGASHEREKCAAALGERPRM